jgi:hypothetical protein
VCRTRRRRRAKQWAAAILFSHGLPRGGERRANFLPGDAFGKLPRTVRCPDPRHVATWQRQWRSVTFKLNQLSLACPVKRAQPPWTVDDKALMP